MSETHALRCHPTTAARVAAARAFLAALPADQPALVVAATTEAAQALLLGDVAAHDAGARFGVWRLTLGQLALACALPRLTREGTPPIGALAREALCARVVHRLRQDGHLGRLERVGARPGVPAALAATFRELGLEGVTPADLAPVDADLAALFRAYREELDTLGRADDADVLHVAASVLHTDDDAAIRRVPALGHPTLLLDVPLDTAHHADLVRALAARAPTLLYLVPSHDEATLARAGAALGLDPRPLDDDAAGATDPTTSLGSIHRALFRPDVASTGPDAPDASLRIISAPGEGRECTEIARMIRDEAARGVPFDQIAVALHAPAVYRGPMIEALRRAGVPAWLGRGARWPDPAGRAFLALLQCAEEGLSSRRFAEYLALGESRRPDPAPRDAGAPAPWAPPDGDWAPRIDDARDAADAALASLTADDLSDDARYSPRHWERLLRDAAVIGGRDRWHARLQALATRTRRMIVDLDAEDPEHPRKVDLARDLARLDALAAFALPLIDDLAALPTDADAPSWETWLAHLDRLADRALSRPTRVLSLLADLAPMGPVGPVSLLEVRLVLARHLGELPSDARDRPAGRVAVATIAELRGRSFRVVFVPGLQEKTFPQKIIEDPLLLDATRAALGLAGAGLATRATRAQRERLALALAVGAATERLVASWARVEPERARPRVPSFYALELLRAAEGRLPDFEGLMQRAETGAAVRLGWPAPEDPDTAIDDAEYDLAVLRRVLAEPQWAAPAFAGTLRYLLDANPHLARALRFRARRGIKAWTPADGLKLDDLDLAGHRALAPHSLGARSFSPTALQTFAECPYKFLLYTVYKLGPVREPEQIERLDPLQRGSLVHDVQFELLTALQAADLLPLTDARRDAVLAHLDATLARLAEERQAELAPAVDRVWRDEIASIKADLRGWLTRLHGDPTWTPHRFELAFGLDKTRGAQDAHSRAEPVPLDCGVQLRGAIDLVERAADGSLRATDHKTGRPRGDRFTVIEGGTILQPVFYALVLEKLNPGARVVGGRLHYCTERGGYHERVIDLDDRARAAADLVATALRDALARGFFPAHPRTVGRAAACRYCDYLVVCGPNEPARVRRKARKKDLDALLALRGHP